MEKQMLTKLFGYALLALRNVNAFIVGIYTTSREVVARCCGICFERFGAHVGNAIGSGYFGRIGETSLAFVVNGSYVVGVCPSHLVGKLSGGNGCGVYFYTIAIDVVAHERQLLCCRRCWKEVDVVDECGISVGARCHDGKVFCAFGQGVFRLCPCRRYNVLFLQHLEVGTVEAFCGVENAVGFVACAIECFLPEGYVLRLSG